MNREEFIKQVAICAQQAYKTIGKVKPSICIGMACVESAYGTAGSCKHHSYLGYKVGSGKTATQYWDGTFFTSKTKEEYTVGQHTVITSAFRSYKDMRQCIFNFYELLNTSLYKKVLSDSNYQEQMKQIKSCGYMTSSTEVNSVLQIIKKYNLTKYDNPDEDYIIDKTYVTHEDLYIRNAPNGDYVSYEDLTDDAKKNAYIQNGTSILRKGTKVTCKEVKNLASGSVWIKIPSGWVCAYNKSKDRRYIL